MPRPPAGPLAGRAAGRGAFGLPGARRARRQHRPRGPFGHCFLPSRDRYPDQQPPPRTRRGTLARRGRRPRPPAPLPQRCPVAERPHAHQRGEATPSPGRPGARVLGGHDLRHRGLAVPGPAGRADRRGRLPVHRLHDGRPRRRPPRRRWPPATTWPRCTASWPPTRRSPMPRPAWRASPATGTWSCGSARPSRCAASPASSGRAARLTPITRRVAGWFPPAPAPC